LSLIEIEMAGNKSQRRRRFLKTTGAVAVGSAIPFSGTASADGGILDSAFDRTTGALQESLVVFDSNDDVDQLGTLNLTNGYHKFDVLPIGYTELSVNQLETVADWDSVRYVQKNVELDYYNDDSREVTGVNDVQSDLGYTGDGVHTAVIDSGVDGDHPDLESRGLPTGSGSAIPSIRRRCGLGRVSWIPIRSGTERTARGRSRATGPKATDSLEEWHRMWT
jgi:serine protease AprX